MEGRESSSHLCHQRSCNCCRNLGLWLDLQTGLGMVDNPIAKKFFNADAY